MDDSLVLQGLRDGHEKTFDWVFRQHYAPLCAFAAKILGDREQAEELVQNLFVQLWEQRGRLGPIISVQGYLYRSTRNACLNHLKHAQVRDRHADQTRAQGEPFSTPAQELEVAELEARIHDVVRDLPERCREVFELSRGEGLKYHEIADRLHISPRTVEVQIGKALRILRERLRDLLPVLLALTLLGSGAFPQEKKKNPSADTGVALFDCLDIGRDG